MTAELEFINGQAQVMTTNDAWHRLSIVKGRTFTFKDIREANLVLNLLVRKVPEYAQVGDPSWLGADAFKATGMFSAVREDDAVVGTGLSDRYEVVQHEEIYELGEPYGELLSAGTLREGRLFFYTYDLGKTSPAGVDIQNRLSFLSSHDGSVPIIGLISPTVVVCMNTFNASLAGATSTVRLRHTASVGDKMKQAATVLGIAQKSIDQFAATVEELAGKTITTRAFDLMLDGIFPVEEKVGRSATLAVNARQTIRQLYENSNIVAGFEGTAWGAVQAVQTYEMWGSTIRHLNGRDVQQVRAERQVESLFKGGQPLTRQALALLTV